MAKTKLLLLVDVDEDLLPAGNAYTELPDKVYDAIAGLSALELSSMYMLNPKEDAESRVRGMVLNYHHYATNIRGETCEEEDCEIHPNKNVVSFHDHKQRHSPAPGVN